MKNEQILRAISDIENELILAAKEDMAMTKKKTVRPLRIALIAAAAILLLAGTVLAAYQLHVWHTMMEAQYEPDEAQKEMVDPAMHDVGVSVTQDGCTYTIRQILGDDYFMAVALDVQLPEGTAYSEFTTEELKTISEGNGYPWTVPETVYDTWSVTKRLSDLYDFDSSEKAFAGGARIDLITLAPTTTTQEEIIGVLNEAQERFADVEEKPPLLENTAIDIYLNDKVIEEQYGDNWDGSYDGNGSGVMQQSFDPDTNTLSLLICAYTGSDTQMSGHDYTLVLDHLMVEDILGTYSKPSTDDFYPDEEETELTSSPVVLNFKADYQSISQEYDILENGETIGTISLSPLSMYLEISLEDEPTEFSSLEAAAQGGHKRRKLMDDVMLHDNVPSVLLEDGTQAEYMSIGCGATDHFSAQLRAVSLIDLTQVKEILWDGYTIVPR